MSVVGGVVWWCDVCSERLERVERCQDVVEGGVVELRCMRVKM